MKSLVTIDVGMEVNEFELYLYLLSNQTEVPQLVYHRKASGKPIRIVFSMIPENCPEKKLKNYHRLISYETKLDLGMSSRN